MKRLLPLFAFLFAVPAFGAHPGYRGAVAGLETCDSGQTGRIASITDGADAADCTVGSGSEVVLCQCDGTTWVTKGGSGGGNVSNSGTPANDQIGIWVNSTTIEGSTALTMDASDLTITSRDVRIEGSIPNLYLTPTGIPDDAGIVFSDGIADEWVILGDANGIYIEDAVGPVKVVTIQNDAPVDSLVIEATTGDIGIGTTSPTADLHVTSSAGQVVVEDTDTTGRIVIRNDVATPASGVTVGQLFFQGNDSGGSNASYARIDGVVSDDTDTSEDGYMEFNVMDAGSITEIAQIDSSGLTIVGVLTITPQASAPGTCAIGDFYVDTSGAACACSATNTWSNMHATGTCV